MSRLQKWTTILAGCLTLAYLAWPYASLTRIYFYLKGGDEAQLRQQVDWASLRQGFREDLNRFALAGVSDLLGGRAKDRGVRLSLSWSSLSITDQIADVLATPRGLIAIFDNSKEFRCVLRALDPGQKGMPLRKCMAKAAPASKGARSYPVQGPNIMRWIEKLNYAFFTDPFTFQLDVMHGTMRVILVLERQGMGWKVTRITMPFKKIISQAP
ncbi:MAG: DUF2939 domain-containing protein [Proteobacteria bacterium]|nr:DUF2939 domain-containing protein [Pseudomonadota bacterium]